MKGRIKIYGAKYPYEIRRSPDGHKNVRVEFMYFDMFDKGTKNKEIKKHLKKVLEKISTTFI